MNKKSGNYFKLQDMHFDAKQILGDREMAVAIGIHPIYKFENGKATSEIIGKSLTCFAADKESKVFKLKVYGDGCHISEEIFKEKSVISLEIIDFKGKFYVWKGQEYFTATAKEVREK
ncbi:MAG: hypothetical protein ACERKN_22155 [Velocimicrobium sp.]